MDEIFFPRCPCLPDTPDQMDAGALSDHGKDRGAGFYLTALTYGHYLWLNGFSARAILKLDRALGADLRGDEEVLREWPLPYEAMVWFLRYTPEGVFMGNPRVHFQHLADRMNEPRREQRRWRMWACWALTREILPHLEGDPKHVVDEPSLKLVTAKLVEHGIPGELALWQAALEKARTA